MCMNAIDNGTTRETFAIVLALVIAMSTTSSLAQDGSQWIGKRVVAKARNMELRVGDEVVAVENGHQIYTVQRSSSGWFWVVAGSTKGWIQVDEVVGLDQATTYFSELVRLEPSNAWAYGMRGVIRQDKHELDKAIADYDMALRLDRNLYEILNNRGHAWASKHNYDRATADFNDAIRLEPNHPQFFVNRGNAWSAQGKFNRAVADYSEAIRLAPDLAMAYNNRGYAWFQQQNLDRAIADYDKALQLDKSLVLAYHNRAVVWEALGELKRALAEYDEAIRLDPQDSWSFNGRAWLRASCADSKYRDGKRAVDDATRACELSKWSEPAPLDTLATALAESGEFAKAIELEEKALSQTASDADPDRRARLARLALYRQRKPFHRESTAK
jgi:tetratricopeptide (TPR) repeat protein